MNTDEPHIDADLARRLVQSQFPNWSSMDVSPLKTEGWCNRTFRLGEEMMLRMPRHRAYAAQISQDYEWLPRLAPQLPIIILEPLAIGAPDEGYPWNWSIYRWIEGEIATPDRVVTMVSLAQRLADFLASLHRIPTQDGPPPGPHNFYRGGALATYDTQTREAVAALGSKVDTETVLDIWDEALATSWQSPPVWVHGDVSVGNLLVRRGELCAVIDFGNLAIGDPACDLAMNWTVFSPSARAAFRQRLSLDEDTWARGRAWVLWKVLILASGLARSNAFEASEPLRIIERVLSDHQRNDA